MFESLINGAWLIRNFFGVSPFYLAAGAGLAQLIPQVLITARNMLIGDNAGWTPMAAAAFNGKLHTLPAAVITTRTLTANDGR